MNTPNASRRAMLGAIAATPLLALLSTPAAASTAEWQAALSDYRKAAAAHEAALNAHGAVELLYFDQRPTRPTYVIEAEGDYGRFGRHTLPVTIFEDDLKDETKVFDTPERTAEMREGFAAYHREKAAVKERTGYAASEERYLRAMTADSEALKRLLATPAPSFPALAEKIGIIIAQYDDDSGALRGVLADVRRLSGEARP